MTFSYNLLRLLVKTSWSRWLLHQRRPSIPGWSELTFHMHPLGNHWPSTVLSPGQYMGFYFFSSLLVLCSFCLSCKLDTLKGKSSIGTWHLTATIICYCHLYLLPRQWLITSIGTGPSAVGHGWAIQTENSNDSGLCFCVFVCMYPPMHVGLCICVSQTLWLYFEEGTWGTIYIPVNSQQC